MSIDVRVFDELIAAKGVAVLYDLKVVYIVKVDLLVTFQLLEHLIVSLIRSTGFQNPRLIVSKQRIRGARVIVVRIAFGQ